MLQRVPGLSGREVMVWQFLYRIDIRNLLELFLYSSKTFLKEAQEVQILAITGTKNVRNEENSSEAGFS